VLRVSGGHGVNGSHNELLPQRCAPLVLPQIRRGRGILLGGDRGLRTGLPDTGQPVGPDLGDAGAVGDASGRHSSFH